jgi:tetratricopeptide (TPR) repeat protein
VLAWGAGDLDGAETLLEDALALARARGGDVAVSRALNDVGLVAVDRGDRLRALEAFEESLALARRTGDPAKTAPALSLLAEVAEPSRQPVLLEEALDAYRGAGRTSGVANVLMQLGWLDVHRSAAGQAEDRFAESAALWERTGNRTAAALALCGRADAARLAGRLQEERDHLEAARRHSVAVGSAHVVGLVAARLADATRRDGDLPAAGRSIQEALDSFPESPPQGGRAVALGYAALVELAGDHPDLAERLASESRAIWDRLGRVGAVAWTRSIGAAAARDRGDEESGADHLRAALAGYRASLDAPVSTDAWVGTGLATMADLGALLDLVAAVVGQDDVGAGVAARALAARLGSAEPVSHDEIADMLDGLGRLLA